MASEALYNRNTRKCQLCSREKLEILRLMKNKGAKSLNKRDEITRRCIHRFKHQLGAVEMQVSNELTEQVLEHEQSISNERGDTVSLHGDDQGISNERGDTVSLHGDEQGINNECGEAVGDDREDQSHSNERGDTQSQHGKEQSISHGQLDEHSVSNERGDTLMNNGDREVSDKSHSAEPSGITRSGRRWRNEFDGIT